MQDNKYKETKESPETVNEESKQPEVQVLSSSEPESEYSGTGESYARKENVFVRGWRSFSAWIKKLVKPLGPPLKRVGKWFDRKLGKFISPAFFVMLLLSVVMWYMIKLGYTYRTEIPITINVEGHQVRVTCVAEGEGYSLFTNRYYNRRDIYLKWSDLEVSPSAINPRAVVISPYSLQNAVSVRRPDIKIVSMGAIPEVEL